MIKLLVKSIKSVNINVKKIYLLSLLSAVFEMTAYANLALIINILNNKKLNLQFQKIINYDLNIIDLSITLIILFFFKSFFQIYTNYLAGKETWNSRSIVSQKLLNKYAMLDYDWIIQKKFGDLVNIITIETNRFSQFIKIHFELITKLILIMILLSFLLLNYFYYTLTIIIINIIIFLLLKNKISNFSKNIGDQRLIITQEHTNAVTNFFSSLEEAKIWNFEKKLCENYLFIGNKFSEIYRKYQFYPTLIVPIIEVVLIFVIFSFFIFVKKYDLLTSNLISNFVIILIVSIRIFQQSANLLASIMKIKSLNPSVNFILHELSNSNNRKKISNLNLVNEKIENIKIRNLNFSYKNNSIFQNANVEFLANSINVILAETGAGKSTLLNLITGLLSNYSGNIHINGKELKKLDKETYQNKISYVVQSPFMINDTVENNININSNTIDENKFNFATNISGVSNFINEKKKKFKTVIEEKNRNFSLGQIQKIALARAVYRDPDIFILDEFTSAMDIQTQKEIIKNINKLKKNKIIIIVTHRLEILDIADNIYRIKDKKIFRQ